VYVSPFSSEPRNQQSASARQADSYAVGTGYQLPDTSDYGTHPLPILKTHDYSNAQIVQDPKYTEPEAPHEIYVEPVHETHVHVHPAPDAYGEPAPDTYAQPAPDTYGEPVHHNYVSPLEEYVEEPPEEPPAEPQVAPAPALGLLQLLPLFVITVLAVIASTIVGALLG